MLLYLYYCRRELGIILDTNTDVQIFDLTYLYSALNVFIGSGQGCFTVLFGVCGVSDFLVVIVNGVLDIRKIS